MKKRYREKVAIITLVALLTTTAIVTPIVIHISNKNIIQTLNNETTYLDEINKASENTQKIILENKSEPTIIELKNEILNSFSTQSKIELNIKSSIYDTINTDQNRVSNQQILGYAKIKSLEYFDLQLENNFSLNDLIEIANQSGYSYEEQQKDLESIKVLAKNKNLLSQESKSNTNLINRSLLLDTLDIDNKPISYILDSMQEAGIKAGYCAVAALAIAAGYWAAACFFGLTIPAAIASTSQAVLFGVEGAAYGGLYEDYKDRSEYLNIQGLKVLNSYSALTWTISVAHSLSAIVQFVETIKTAIVLMEFSTILIQTGIWSTSWAAPSGLIFIAVCDLALQISSLILNFPFQ